MLILNYSYENYIYIELKCLSSKESCLKYRMQMNLN